MSLAPTDPNGREILDAYFRAASGSEIESALEQIRCLIRPVLAGSIRAKLNVSMRNGDRSQLNQDALDLAAETELLLFSRLEKLKRTGEDDRIENLEGYVRQVTQNAFNQYLRSRHPVRSSLRNQIRYILSHDPGLPIDTEGPVLCSGISGKTGITGPVLSPRALESLRSKAGLPLPEFVAAVIEASDVTPSLERLVSIVFDLKGLCEQHQVDETIALSVAGTAGSQEASVEHREMLVRVWNEITKMPLLHRRALLLNLTGRSGESLIQEIPILRVASIRSIAASLEIPDEEFAELWDKLPIDDKRIAELCSVSRQQVINLRQSARARLKRRLVEPAGEYKK